MEIEKFELLVNICKTNEDIEVITACLNNFADYFNHVVKMNIFATTHKVWNKPTEYMYIQMDNQRRELHDICVMSCARINEIAESYNLGVILEFDITDRKAVARFIAFLVTNIYLRDVSPDKSFDDLICEFSKSKELVVFDTNKEVRSDIYL